jgi:hypothetical protein
VALLDQLGTTVKPGKLRSSTSRHVLRGTWRPAAFILDAHHDERGFATMHIYHVASNAPVAAILRPARTPKGSDRRGLLSFSTMEEVVEAAASFRLDYQWHSRAALAIARLLKSILERAGV